MLDNVQHLPSVQNIINTANKVLGFDVLEKCGVGARDLNNTIFAQPLMFVAGMVHSELMKQKHPTIFTKVKAVAGFSLGEITALCYAEAISFDDALKLVNERAKAMAKCPGGAMCSVVGMSLLQVKSLCKTTGCTIANIICNHQDEDLVKHNILVCAGKAHNIVSLIQAAESSGGKAKRLRVSGAFHSAAMLPAQTHLNDVLKQIHISLPSDKLIYSNVTGRPYRSVREIRLNLSRHLVKPVLWHEIIHSLLKDECVKLFVECGPQKVLSKTIEAHLKGLSDEENQCCTILSSDS